jgi:hypothetical protein
MIRRTGFLFVMALACVVGGCHASASALPDAETAREYVADRCEGVNGDAAIRIVWKNVEQVEPLTAIEPRAKGDIMERRRLVGARLHVRPQTGVTRELLERGVRCHVMRDVAARDAALVVDAVVESSGDGFVVVLKMATPEAARRLLDDAQRTTAKAQSPREPSL